MYYQRAKRRRSKRKQWLGVLLLVLATAAVIAVYGLKLRLQREQVELDPSTLCPLAGSSEYVAIVFDKTDTYNQVQQKYLRRFFARFKAELPVGARVSLYVIDDHTKDHLAPDFVVCNPGSGEQANSLYQNPALLTKRWREHFQQPLDQAIGAFMQPAAESRSSPIMEMLQVVALTAFPSPEYPAKRRIILVSDMLHHTPEWSHYRGQMDFEALKQTAYYQKVSTDLGGAEVQILYVRRDGAERLQTKRHALFWADYIDSIDGRVTLVERIDG